MPIKSRSSSSGAAKVGHGSRSRVSLPSLPSTPSTTAGSSPTNASSPSSPSSPLSPATVSSGFRRGSGRSSSLTRGNAGMQALPSVSGKKQGLLNLQRASQPKLALATPTSSLFGKSAKTSLGILSGLQSADSRWPAETSYMERRRPEFLFPPECETISGYDSGCHAKGVDEVEGAEPEPVDECGFSATPALLVMHGACASSVLQYLKIREIADFHFASQTCHKFCRAARTNKLVVPTLVLRNLLMDYVDLASVETLYADDAGLTSVDQNDQFAKWLSTCTSLRHLYCAQNKGLIVATFARAMPALSNLVALDLAHNRLAVDERTRFQRPQALTPICSRLPLSLQILDLSYNLLQDDHVHELVDALETTKAAGATGLEKLMLRSNYIGNGAGFALGHLMRNPAGSKLYSLDLRTNRVEAEGACAMLAALQEHRRMREMRVGYNRQNARQDLETARLATILLQKALSTNSRNQLELLDLNNVRVGDEGISRMAIALSLNMLLKTLCLAFNSIGSKGAEALATALEHNVTLEILDIRDNEVGDEGAQALANSLKLNRVLKDLRLARNNIGNVGALALMSAVHVSSQLKVDFGASGGGTSRLQGMMSRDPSLADLRAVRDAERELAEASAAGAADVSMLFSY
mmetsp:Transcript_158590/g.280071  ORF Transcript_158590/g.280071 Transcript_158590/m.280071 type:complete len:639 (-) Transcript_158590:31-1947(-)